MLGGTIDDRLDATDVGLPGAVGTSVRVGDLNTKGHALVAKLALCHPLHLLAVAYFYAFFIGTADIITEKKITKNAERLLSIFLYHYKYRYNSKYNSANLNQT